MIGTGYGRRQAWALVQRVAIAVVGGIITTAGIVLLFIPGPGLLVLLLGLAILATEFVWARQVRQWVHREARSITQRLEAKRR
ncbi:MAG: PGPGW domain-containing protein [Egibacteraceae bacterium]